METKVHSFHVNIDVGDCAIHLLVDQAAKPRPQIRKAVLIDGGKASKVQAIKNVIAEIEARYQVPVGDANLKFDSVIMTHWDIDHWEGVMELLAEDFRARLANHPDYKAAINKSFVQFQKLILDKSGTAYSDADFVAKYNVISKSKTKQKTLNYYNGLLDPSAREDCDHVKKLGSSLAFQSRYLRYSNRVPLAPVLQTGDAAFNLTVDDCLTKFYVPYMVEAKIGWVGPFHSTMYLERDGKIGGGGGGDGDGDDEDIKPQPKKRARKTKTDDAGTSKPPPVAKPPLKIAVFRCNQDNSYKTAGRNFISITAPIKYDLGIPWPVEGSSRQASKKDREKVWRFNLAGELFDRAKEYLGAEVFMGGPFADKTLQSTIKNPAALLKAHIDARMLKLGDGPRMFILASDQWIIGETPLKTPADTFAAAVARKRIAASNAPATEKESAGLAFRPRRKVIDATMLADGRRYPTRNETSHNKNSASIVCMIIEATGDNSDDGRNSFRIHHFLGGDSLWDVEGGLVAWLKNNLDRASPKNWSCKSECMKLSHHGGKESTQVNLLGELAPNFIVGSIPEGGDYCHPHGETLAYLDAAIAALRSEDRKLVGRQPAGKKYTWTDRYSPLLLTNYPAWFSKDFKPIYSLDTFISTTKEEVDRQFQTDLTKMYAMSGTNPNIFTMFVALYSNTTRAAVDGRGTADVNKKDEDLIESTRRRKYLGSLIETRWAEISSQPSTLKPLAWVMQFGIGPAPEPQHGAILQDRKWYMLKDHPPAKQEAIIALPMPASAKDIDPSKSVKVVNAVAPMDVVRTKPVRPPRSRALWARIGEVPGDLEGDEPPVPTKAASDMMMDVSDGGAKPVMLFKAEAAVGISHHVGADAGGLPATTAAPVVAFASANASRFFVYSSIYNVDSTNPNELVLDDTNLLDKFLSGLKPAYWVTDTLLSTAGSRLSADGQWVQAVTSTSLNISAINAKASVTDQKAQVTEVNASVSNANRTLLFSTQSTYKVMINGAGPGRGFAESFYPGSSNAIVVDPRSSGTALLDMPSPEYNLLVLGLSSVTPDGNASTPEALKAAAIFSLGDILKFFGPHWLADLSELSGFGPDLNFVLNAGGAGTRNCLAFQATSSYPTYLRLQFDVPQDSLGAFKSKFQARLSFLGSIDLRDACIICRKQSAATTSVMDGQTSTSSRITSFFCIQTTVVIGGLNLRLILEYATNGAPKLIIRFNDEKKSLADALQWILSSLEIEGDPTDLLPGSGHIYVRQLELQLGSPSGGGPFAFKGSTITLTLEVDIFDAAFFVVVTWSHSFRLHAYLWTDVSAEPDSRMLPWFEEYFDIEPSDPTGFDPLGPGLTNFLPSSMRDLKIPPSVDFRMTVADFEAWIDENKNTALIFRATLAPKAPATDGPALDIDSLSFLAKRTTNGAESSYEIDISTVLYLLPRNFNPNALGKDSFYAAQVYAALNIADGVWTITAAAYDIRFAALYSLLDASASESIMDVLEHFSVPRIEFEFVYGIDGFSVALSGALRISSFEIDLGYWYDSADKSWTFQGQLGFISDKAKITIADIVRDFDASIADVLDDIEFVKNIAVPAINKDATDFDSAPIQFYMTHTTDAVIMWFQIEIDSDIGAFTFLFAQYKPVPQVNDQGKLPARQKPKRLIRVRLDQLPELPNIPIVGSLGGGQPVDSISYVYVQDAEKAKTATTNTPAGFTRAEIAAINDTLQDRNAIKFRDKKSNLRSAQTPSQDIPDKNTAAPDYVLLTGHHFVVVTDGNVILDHQFGNKPATGKKDGNSPAPLVKHVGGGPVARSAAIVKDQATEGDSGATVGQSKRSFPGVPITIDNFGIQVKDKRLYLLIDATVMLGPIKLSLEGFGIGIPLSGISFAELKKPEVIKQFDFKLTGVGVYFNAPPVLIAGCFFHIDTDEFEAYRGGLAVSILPYTLLAVGSYEKTKLPKEFKSVFVFARLEGPLFTLEFAEISGVSAGFGYNYSLRMPTAADIQDFPLVHGAESDPDPMKLLSSRPTERSSFVNWNTRQESSLWFAIGMKVDAFQVLTVDAAAILSFSAESVKIALVGIASASMPPAVGKGKPPQAFIYVELGIVASLDILGGSLYVGAQLTPNSYILAPDCHLTGGFALCYWFGRNEHAGDWVFTVGGYHPAFQKPEHYPDVPRLGISWNLSDVLTVRGESYFAICPKACMGGGRLLATFNSGPIRASFEAWASFLINFKPFFFVADIGITLSVGCHIDFWIIHIHVEASLGADLHLQGPPFGGVAHVHFWVMGFSVYFGDQNNVPDPLSWKDFLPLVKQPGPGSDANKTAMCVIAIEKGSADEKTSKTGRETGDKWFVRAGSFQYRIETKFPIDSMDYGKKFKGPVAKTERIYGRPMQLQNPYTSTLHIEINAPGTETDPNPWLVQPLIRSLPKALWAQYSRGEDPVRAGNNIGTLLSGNTADATIDHLVGFTIRSPDPKLPSWSFPEFDAMAAMQEGVFQDGVTDPSEKPVRRNALLGPATEDDERPVLKGTPAPQTADLPVDKKPDVWVDDKSLKDGGFMDVGPSFDELEGVWKQVDEEATQLVADVWGDMMGWWGPEVPGGLVSSLSGKKPSWLMGAQERFETFYLEAPWLTKVTAAESAPVAA